MSGLEVAAAIFGIIGGIASAYKMVRELRKHHRKGKKNINARADRELSERIEQRLKRIENQLKVSQSRLGGLNHGDTASGKHTALCGDIALQNVLVILQRMSTVSTEEALGSPTALDLQELEQYTDRWDWEANLISKRVCPNAVRYRQNLCQFGDVAMQRVPGSEWACRLCGISVSAASMPFPRHIQYEGQVHAFPKECFEAQITPNGCFKAHTTSGTSWSCIWRGGSDECLGVFEGRKALLHHMLRVHMRKDETTKSLFLDGPADMRDHSVAKCGYGILHPRKTLEVAGHGFAVRLDD